MIISGVIAVIIAYLLGSIPSAYIITRLKTGKDIRKLGGGNVGARNVFREVGLGAAIAVIIFDMGKGAAAVGIAYWLLGIFDIGNGSAAVGIAYWLLGWPKMLTVNAPALFVLAAGLAVVMGHIWSVYLKFTGGNGIATTIGVLSIVMPRELGIALAITLIFIAITQNPVLSVNISLLISVPVFGYIIKGNNWLYVVFPLILALILVLHFLPTARVALAKAGSRKKLAFELLRIDKAKQARRKTKKKKK